MLVPQYTNRSSRHTSCMLDRAAAAALNGRPTDIHINSMEDTPRPEYPDGGSLPVHTPERYRSFG